jgi:FKBP-type peptidyl-prolyl cis-trans isomerase
MKMRASEVGRGRLLGLLLLAAAMPACSDDPTGPQGPEDVEFAAVLGIDLDAMTRLPSGVYVQTTREGEDPAVTASSTIRANYDLWLPDATVIASGALDEPVAEFIEGFQLGIIGMKTDEIRWIVIPSELAYGARGNPNAGIPPHAVIVFQVEMLEVS